MTSSQRLGLLTGFIFLFASVAKANGPDKSLWGDYLKKQYGDSTVLMRSGQLKKEDYFSGYKAVGAICLERTNECQRVQYVLLNAKKVGNKFEIETEELKPETYEHEAFPMLMAQLSVRSKLGQMFSTDQNIKVAMNISFEMMYRLAFSNPAAAILSLPLTLLADIVSSPIQLAMYGLERASMVDDLTDTATHLGKFLYQGKSGAGELVRNDGLFIHAYYYMTEI